MALQLGTFACRAVRRLLAAAAAWLLAAKRGVVSALLGVGALGILAALAGWHV